MAKWVWQGWATVVAAQLAKTGVYQMLNEDFEPFFNAASASAVVVQRFL
jgi:hypothetical protein